MSPLELVDDRFGELARELRAARPGAPERLCSRVEQLTRAEPKSRRELGFRLPSRRLVITLAALAILGSFVAVGVTGLGGSRSDTKAVAHLGEVHGAATSPPTTEAFGSAGALRAGLPAPSFGPYLKDRALSPTQGRLQQYEAALTLRVDDTDQLSARTQQAMRLTRSLGGYVVSASFDVPGHRGASTLILRVPIGNVQKAIADLSGYGTLLAQKISVQDLQQQADRQAARIVALRRTIAAIEARLDGPLSTDERMRLERQLSFEEQQLARMLKRREATLKRGHLARLSLTLVTAKPKPAAASSRIDRTLDDAGSVLARELQVLLYALIVAGPLLLLGGLALVAARTQRSRSDRRLLERS